jgi:hypothetical protein
MQTNVTFFVSNECENFIDTLRNAIINNDPDSWAELSEWVHIKVKGSANEHDKDEIEYTISFEHSEDFDDLEGLLHDSLYEGDEEADNILYENITEIELVNN